MCGICGIMNFDRPQAVSRPVLEAMNRRILHRGPDEDGFYVRENVGLGMRRLSIIDLKTGQQPVTNEEGTVWLVFNGEIYNYRDLRAQLLERGHRFRSHSDTETIVHLYEEYGPDCVRHLRGMFAFVLWDQQRRKLFAARDRLGIKPLYYRLTPRDFICASEIKALLEYPGVSRELYRPALPEYLAFGYLTGPETLFSGILKLMPGHTLELEESGKLTLTSYWDLPQPASGEAHPEQYYVDGYRQMLESCVGSHLMSDVPLGMFLSGGLDSSAVAALATKLRGGPIETFSVGYDEVPYSELPYAQAVAEHLKSEHHEVRVSRQEFFDALPRLIWHEDEPLAWPSSVSLYFVARLARERVVVVLTGEGSDETLAGYARYPWTLWNMRLHRLYRRLTPAGFRRLVRGLAQSGPWSSDLKRRLQHTFLGRDGDSLASLYLDNYLCAFSAEQEQGLLADGLLQAAPGPYEGTLRYWEQSSGDLLRRLLYTDIKTYLVELLMKQDQMSMAASVESRVPFLDHVLVEYAAAIPSRYKTRGLAGKCTLKAAVRDLLPESIIYRRKMGFPTPWKAWLDGPAFPQVEALLTEPASQTRSLLRPEAVRRLLAEHRSGHTDHSDRLWRLLNLELWMRVFLGDEPQGELASAAQGAFVKPTA